LALARPTSAYCVAALTVGGEAKVKVTQPSSGNPASVAVARSAPVGRSAAAARSESVRLGVVPVQLRHAM
jgi:hypothetical protein